MAISITPHCGPESIWVNIQTMTDAIFTRAGPICVPLARESNPHKRMLMVEDDADTCRLNTEELKCAGYFVDSVEDGVSAWDVLQLNSYHLLITDQRWPKLSGVDLLKKIHDTGMAIPVIMITDVLAAQEFAEHPWIQPDTMLVEPYTSAVLLAMVGKAVSTSLPISVSA